MPSAHSKPKKAHGKQTAHRPAAKPPSTKQPSAQPTTMKLPITTTTTRPASSKRPSTHDSPMPPPAKKPRSSPPTTTPTAAPPITTTPLLHTSLTPTTHTIHATQIITSTKMQTKISTLLTQLRSFSFSAPAAKPVIVIAWAKAKAAGKLVSVVEVVKREIAGEGGVWFQYNGLGEGVGGVPREGEEGEEGEGEEGAEQEEGFEKMKTRIERAIEGTEKVRSVPVMTVYLSRVRVEALREAYGEQTNSKR
ncbi:hypothetical protein VE03_05998 [Pseudogymnoascus sp. 23342-1-I1]|nr:hypothetical protein VE03_05998 [Pseudogymnoascus sp. 23342-1-I1]